jgi:hypothetical protein
MKKKLFSWVKYDNLTVFEWKLYSGVFDIKVDFWPRKWTLGAKLSKKRIKWNFFFTVKIKSFLPNFFWKTPKYHVPNKPPFFFVFLRWLLATLGNFDMNEKTRLKGLPVISREHFCKTRTNCYEILPCSNFTSNTKIGTSIVTSTTNCYFNYQLLLRIPKLVLRIPKLVLRIPIVTLTTNCYFKYQLLLPIPIVTSDAMSNDPPRTRTTRTTTTTKWLLEPR